MFKKLSFAAAGLLLAGASHAITVIDTFDDPATITNYLAPASGSQALSPTSSDFSSSRDWSLTYTGTAPGTVEMIVGAGQVAVNSGTGLAATTVLSYNSTDPAGFDLAAPEAFGYTGPYFESLVITLVNIDYAGADFSVTVVDLSGKEWTATQNITLVGIILGGSTLPYDIVFPFDSFTDGLGNTATAADFTQVTSVSLTVSAAEAVDMVISQFNAYGVNVPEPGPLALLGLGLAGLGLMRRRKAA